MSRYKKIEDEMENINFMYSCNPQISVIILPKRRTSMKEPVAKEPVYWNVLPCEIPQLDIPNVGKNHSP